MRSLLIHSLNHLSIAVSQAPYEVLVGHVWVEIVRTKLTNDCSKCSKVLIAFLPSPILSPLLITDLCKLPFLHSLLPLLLRAHYTQPFVIAKSHALASCLTLSAFPSLP